MTFFFFTGSSAMVIGHHFCSIHYSHWCMSLRKGSVSIAFRPLHKHVVSDMESQIHYCFTSKGKPKVGLLARKSCKAPSGQGPKVALRHLAQWPGRILLRRQGTTRACRGRRNCTMSRSTKRLGRRSKGKANREGC